MGLALVDRPFLSTHTLLLVVDGGEVCYPDTTPEPGNVLGQWLHVKLLVWVVASVLLTVSW